MRPNKRLNKPEWYAVPSLTKILLANFEAPTVLLGSIDIDGRKSRAAEFH